MKLVSVTRTGNEADIIEPFVRHHAHIVDLMMIIDDHSTDATAGILEALRDEGLPLIIFNAAELDWNPFLLNSELMHRAFRDHGADWVTLLDADEFIEPPSDTSLASLLPETSELALQLRWNNFVWRRSLNEAERNPVVRLTTRMPARTDSHKVVVPRSVFTRDPRAIVVTGNHNVKCNGQMLNMFHIKGIALCHYPIRSLQQFISKSVINHLRYTALPQRPPGGFQYDRPIELIKSDPRAIVAEMERESQVYALQQGGSMSGERTEQPLDYRGGTLAYSGKEQTALANIVSHSERLARRVGELEAERIARR